LPPPLPPSLPLFSPSSPPSVSGPSSNGANDFDSAVAFLSHEFLNLNQNPRKEVYHHHTSAIDTNQIKFVLSAVTDTLINNSLRHAGLI
jgi:VanZ family protein